MAYPKPALNLTFKFNLNRPTGEYDGVNNHPIYFSFADKTDYTGISEANGGIPEDGDYTDMKSRIKILSPANLAIYTSPDFGDTDTWDDTFDFGASTTGRLLNGSMSEVKLCILPSNSYGTLLRGDYLVYYETYNGATVVSTTFVLGICCYTTPTGAIDMEYSCETSTLQSTDNTNYGAYVVSDEIVRYHSLVAPIGSGYDVTELTDENLAVLTATANIYTKIWQASLISDFVILVPSSAGTDKYYIYDRVSVSDSIDVQCNDSICQIMQCYKNLSTKYENYRTYGNKAMIDATFDKLNRCTIYLTQYQMAVKCGTQYTDIALEAKVKLIEILQSENCICETTSDSASTEVIPSTIVIGGGTGTSNANYVDVQAYSTTTLSPGSSAYVNKNTLQSTSAIIKFDFGIPRGASFSVNSIGDIKDNKLTSEDTGYGFFPYGSVNSVKGNLYLLDTDGEGLPQDKLDAFNSSGSVNLYFHIVTHDLRDESTGKEVLSIVDESPIPIGELNGCLIAWNGTYWVSYGTFTGIQGAQGESGRSVQVHKNEWGKSWDGSNIDIYPGDILFIV